MPHARTRTAARAFRTDEVTKITGSACFDALNVHEVWRGFEHDGGRRGLHTRKNLEAGVQADTGSFGASCPPCLRGVMEEKDLHAAYETNASSQYV